MQAHDPCGRRYKHKESGHNTFSRFNGNIVLMSVGFVPVSLPMIIAFRVSIRARHALHFASQSAMYAVGSSVHRKVPRSEEDTP